jgi:D-cysteine desulfhydrase family pyridoxal phosphate-dependent enzyme
MEEKRQDLKERLAKLPRAQLAHLPTPIQKAPRLSKALGGPDIYFKRDDLTGLAFGGNKTRMFEFFFGHVLTTKADCVVAGAAVQSNYCRQIAAACSKLGLEAFLVLRKVRGEKDLSIQGNLLLDCLLGANVHIIEAANASEQAEVMEKLAEDLRKQGRRPYVARMASTADLWLDTASYVSCAVELDDQLTELDIKPDYLYVASADTTQAGLVLGVKYLGLGCKVVGFNPLDKTWVESVPALVSSIANACAKHLGLPVSVETSEVISHDEYVGKRYGQVTSKGIGKRYGRVTPKGIEALKLVARTEGIFLDPVYTGKAMAGLIDSIRQGKIPKDHTVIFLHTGGFPALFAYHDEFGDLISQVTIH